MLIIDENATRSSSSSYLTLFSEEMQTSTSLVAHHDSDFTPNIELLTVGSLCHVKPSSRELEAGNKLLGVNAAANYEYFHEMRQK